MNLQPSGTGQSRSSEVKAAERAILDRYEPVIGLEVHCQLSTNTKLFCGCDTSFGATPNQNTCPVCLGLPGALPVLNEEAVNSAIRFALAIQSNIQQKSVFARKQYFYPDLPKGYQITQFDLPYCLGGQVQLASGKVIRLIRAHLEEDAGKNVHAEECSFIDLNRAGVPLIEIVSHPDIRTPDEAVDFLKRLRAIVKTLNISDGNLEEGSFRCDVNISIRPRGSNSFGTRCEIKNLNSFRNIERAIKYECMRQIDLLEHGHKVQQQTLLFDAASGKTHPMRSKEESHDYRYFPEPDLLPLRINAERVDLQRAQLPELPDALAVRFQSDFGISSYDAMILTSENDLAAYYESVTSKVGPAISGKFVANWIISEFLREVNDKNWNLSDPPVSADHMAELLNLIGTQVISGRIAKKVFEEMADGLAPDGPRAYVEKRGMIQVTDTTEIRNLIGEIIDQHTSQVNEYLSGQEKIFGFFVGQVMRRSGGRMNPQVVNDLLKEMLNARRSG